MITTKYWKKIWIHCTWSWGNRFRSFQIIVLLHTVSSLQHRKPGKEPKCRVYIAKKKWNRAWVSPQYWSSALLALEGVNHQVFRVVLSDSDSDSGTRKGCFVVKRTHCAGHPGQVRGSLWTGNRQCLPTLTTVVHVALLSFEPPPKHPFLLLLFVF